MNEYKKALLKWFEFKMFDFCESNNIQNIDFENNDIDDIVDVIKDKVFNYLIPSAEDYENRNVICGYFAEITSDKKDFERYIKRFLLNYYATPYQ